ncbi:hypothetical protein Mmc1_2923 [Magnetococcus marinus MC-1]|uniref:Uncharacterized protein n=1 Tax=Magnetococcus marinus (strain ATCC BAA-1437 / JCM 17883 / MC-1) TaxID=156889 RepID=A0LBC4_MAGMM|nr:hypothetical protein [Magnetococcus marinus]ABK45267.1 hypothetical protein Mmc1_2774 [Magnetococcus marinus MC-1]ABK45414.1 hypothetical protein Mmc1_2923 [Magnetococcus marinus MC-1]
MALPPKQYYTIKEVVERWDCSENDLLSYGMEGILELSFWVPYCHVDIMDSEEGANGERFSYPIETRFVSGLLPLLPRDIGIIWSYGEAGVTYLPDTDDGYSRRIKHFSVPGMECEVDTPFPVNRDDIKLSGVAVHRFEAVYMQEQVSEGIPQEVNDEPSLPSHPQEAKDPFSGRHGQSTRHRERIRALAAYIWRENPQKPSHEIYRNDGVKAVACEGVGYSDRTLRRWLSDVAPEGVAI